jgi:hypothetical protein
MFASDHFEGLFRFVKAFETLVALLFLGAAHMNCILLVVITVCKSVTMIMAIVKVENGGNCHNF